MVPVKDRVSMIEKARENTDKGISDLNIDDQVLADPGDF